MTVAFFMPNEVHPLNAKRRNATSAVNVRALIDD
jgi:hypothetical protein